MYWIFLLYTMEYFFHTQWNISFIHIVSTLTRAMYWLSLSQVVIVSSFYHLYLGKNTVGT
jgi:hypothetical protein